MTSTSVKDVSFGLKGPMSAGTGAKSMNVGGFQTVWNNQTGKQTDGAEKQESSQTVRKTPGDSLKARDEHRARTEKREPSRNVEERADISDEELEEAVEVLGTAVVEMIQQVAEAFDMSPEEVQGIMEELGMEQTDVLDYGSLSKLILSVSGAEEASALVTNEELYDSYRQLMGQLENILQECADTLEAEPEQLTQILQQLQTGEDDARAISVEAINEIDDTEEPVEESVKVKADESVDKVQVTAQEGTEETRVGRNSRDTQADTKEQRHGSGKEQGTNLFAQNLRTQQFEPQLQQTQAAESVWDTDTQDIMRQIMDYMKFNLKSDMSSVEMQLHPASLGTLQIQVAAKGGVVTANFIAQNEAVKAALESQMVQLREQFEEQGVKVEAIEVTVQTHQFEQNLEQGRGRNSQGQEPEKKGRIRRIDLNDPLSVEEMEEEDELARDIMEANGNTVDYTV